MHKHESSEKPKLPNRVVRVAGGLVSLFTEYAHSNMGFLYHVDIISAIAYCEGYSLWI
jgi:hypothetical protein